MKLIKEFKFEIVTIVLGSLICIVALTIAPPKTDMTVFVLYSFGMVITSMGYGNVIERAFDEYKKTKTAKQTPSSFELTREQYANKRWQDKLNAELQQIVDAKVMCRCGHAKADHQDNPLAAILGYGALAAMGMRLDSCMNGYIAGESIGCECPAFVAQESIDQ